MTNDYLVRRVFKQFYLASIISLLAATLGMTIDNILAGQLIGPDALAAMSLVLPMFVIVTMFGSILANGGGVIAARYLGANMKHQVNVVFTLVVAGCVLVSAIVILAVLPNAEAIARLLGANNPTLLSMTSAYIRGFMVGVLPIGMVNVLGAFVRVDGSPKLSMTGVVVMSVMDVSLNILFSGVLRMGMFGMALATSLSYTAAMLVVLTHFMKKSNTLRLVKPQQLLKETKGVLANGLPNALQSACNAGLGLILNHIVLALGGAVALTAFSVQNSVRTLLQPVAMGVGYALAPVAGIFYGERDGRSIRDTAKISLRLGVPMCAAVALIVIVLAGPIVSLFNAGEESERLAVLAVRLFALSTPFSVVTGMFMYSYQSINKLWLANLISVLRGLVYNALFAFALQGVMGVTAVWLNVLAAEVLTLITMFIIVFAKQKVRSFSDLLLLPEDCLATPDAYEVSITGRMDDVLSLSGDIYEFCLLHGASRRKAYFTALCIEEMAGNVVKYGFENCEGHFLDIKVVVSGEDVRFRLRDDGVMFDPLRYADAGGDETSNIGIKLVRKIAAAVDYRYSVKLNNLFITI